MSHRLLHFLALAACVCCFLTIYVSALRKPARVTELGEVGTKAVRTVARRSRGQVLVAAFANLARLSIMVAFKDTYVTSAAHASPRVRVVAE